MGQTSSRMATAETCGVEWDQEEWSFVCQLPKGHDGPHEEASEGDGRAYVMQWADKPWRSRRDRA